MEPHATLNIYVPTQLESYMTFRSISSQVPLRLYGHYETNFIFIYRMYIVSIDDENNNECPYTLAPLIKCHILPLFLLHNHYVDSILINEMWFSIVGKNANNNHINRLVSKNTIENYIISIYCEG